MKQKQTLMTQEELDAFYSRQSINELFDNDELTSGEEGFMRGYLDAGI